MGKITLEEFIKASSSPIPDPMLPAVLDLLKRMNAVRQLYGRPMIVSSAYRDPIHNEKIGGAKDSNHCKGLAIDILDPDDRLVYWIMGNQDTLANLGLWCEDPAYTDGWVHFQSIKPKSGKRLFKP